MRRELRVLALAPIGVVICLAAGLPDPMALRDYDPRAERVQGPEGHGLQKELSVRTRPRSPGHGALTLARKKAFEKILAAAYPHVRFRVKVALTVFYEECVAHLDCPVV